MHRQWGLFAIGVVVGIATISGLFYLSRDDARDHTLATPSRAVAPSPSTTTTVALPAPAEVAPFPSDYTAISDTESIKAHCVIRAGDVLFVSLTMVYARGLVSETEPLFLGGSWLLETADGQEIASVGTAFDDAPIPESQVLGSASAAFTVDAGVDVQPKRLRLVDRWDPVVQTESIRIPVSVWPFIDSEPYSVAFDGFTVDITSIFLETYGEITWTIEDDSQLHRLVQFDITMVDENGAPIATAIPGSRTPRTSGFGDTSRVGFDIAPARFVANTAEDRDSFFINELAATRELAIAITITTAEPVSVDGVAVDVSELPLCNR